MFVLSYMGKVNYYKCISKVCFAGRILIILTIKIPTDTANNCNALITFNTKNT